ncbi:MAG: hypothetical protein WD015_00780 [Gaiellaceae bacterium]
MDPILLAPMTQALTRHIDEVLVKTIRNNAVIGERLQLSLPMTTPSARKHPVEVDRLDSLPVSVTDDSRDGSSDAFSAHLVDLFDQLEELRQRDLAPTFGCRDSCDLSLVHPVAERWLTETKQACRLSGPDRGADKVLEKLANGRDVFAHRQIREALGASKTHDVLDGHFLLSGSVIHGPIVSGF